MTHHKRNLQHQQLRLLVPRIAHVAALHALDPLALQPEPRVRLCLATPPLAERNPKSSAERCSLREARPARRSTFLRCKQAPRLVLDGVADHSPQLVGVLLLARCEETASRRRRVGEGGGQLDGAQWLWARRRRRVECVEGREEGVRDGKSEVLLMRRRDELVKVGDEGWQRCHGLQSGGRTQASAKRGNVVRAVMAHLKRRVEEAQVPCGVEETRKVSLACP